MKRLLDINVHDEENAPVEAHLPLVKEAGFDGIFTCFWHEERMRRIASICKTLGLNFTSVHAPFSGVDAVWREGEEGETVLNALLRSLESTAEIGVPVLVSHVYIGFDKNESPTALGVERFSRLVQRAERLGVKIAFENTEGEEFLAALMGAFQNEKHVGFCWDSGHEFCYGKGKDFLLEYGDRLFYTHLNDNFGPSDPNGKITSRDDLHLFPFDGLIDWTNAVDRLKTTGFSGPFSFELKRKSKAGRHENDAVAALPLDTFYQKAYERAQKVASL